MLDCLGISSLLHESLQAYYLIISLCTALEEKKRNEEVTRQPPETERQVIVHLLFFLRTSEINLFYNLQVFYWHFLEILWLFIFLVLYLWFNGEISDLASSSSWQRIMTTDIIAVMTFSNGFICSSLGGFLRAMSRHVGAKAIL